MKKVVITGGAGFIGCNLAHALSVKGYEIHSIDTDYSYRSSMLPVEVVRHEIDVRNPESVSIFEGADTIFHLAAVPRVQYSIEHPQETTDDNVMSTVAVLEAARAHSVRRVVFSSSASVYGEQVHMPLVEDMQPAPVHPYGLHKWFGEESMKLWHSLYGIQTVSLRYFNVYGPYLDPNGPYALAVGRFMQARKEGKPITIFGDGTITRDFVHVQDVAEANIRASLSEKVGKGEVINIGTGIKTSIQTLAEHFGGPILYAAPRVEPHDAQANIIRAQKLLEWRPRIAFADGIQAFKKEWNI